MAAIAAIFGFPIGTILIIFYLQVGPLFPTKFRVNWPFGSELETQKQISRWRPGRTSRISDRNDLSYFDLQVAPVLPTKFRVN